MTDNRIFQLWAEGKSKAALAHMLKVDGDCKTEKESLRRVDEILYRHWMKMTKGNPQ